MPIRKQADKLQGKFMLTTILKPKGGLELPNYMIILTIVAGRVRTARRFPPQRQLLVPIPVMSPIPNSRTKPHRKLSPVATCMLMQRMTGLVLNSKSRVVTTPR
ncbi:hypothetical protein [Photorhabdus sp. SF281]|uniref:hypothetical protein n=1 Tax=Photorhabdus sp. SF281 TaxID=3459527 RepID=UPI004043D2D0